MESGSSPGRQEPGNRHGLAKFVAGVVIAGLVASGGYVEKQVHDAQIAAGSGIPVELPLPTGSSQTLICAATSTEDCEPDTALATLGNGGRYYPVKLDEIPSFTQNALIAIEDRRFYTNSAIDWRSYARAAKVDSIAAVTNLITKGIIKPSAAKVQGGSTIENQLAGIAFKKPFPYSPVKQEIYNDIVGQRLDDKPGYGKKWVLEDYMNRVPLARGAVGVGSASMALYGTPIEQLGVQPGTRAQLGPANYKTKIDHEEKNIEIVEMATGYDYMDVHFSDYSDPANKVHIYNEMVNLRSRFDDVLPAIKSAGVISAEDETALKADMDSRFTFATSDPGHKHDPTGVIMSKIPFIPDTLPLTRDVRNAKAIGAEYFVDYVSQTAKADLGLSPDEPLPAGKIYTTLDLQDQRAMNDAVHNRNDSSARAILDTSSLDIGGISLRKNGSIAALIGSKDYSHEPIDLALGTLGGGSGRAAGSSIKPFFLAYALEHGWTLDKKLHIPKSITVRIPGYKPYVVSSGQGCEFLPDPNPPCDLTVRKALGYSSNMLPALIINQFGLAPIVKDMESLGLPVDASTGAAVMLGVGKFSPMNVAAGYDGLGLNQGRAVAAFAIARIVSPSGQTLSQYTPPQVGAQIYDTDATINTDQALKEVVKDGTAEDYFNDIPNGIRSVGGKTGTSDAIEGSTTTNTDLWFSGVACDADPNNSKSPGGRGSRAFSFAVGDPSGSKPIYGLSKSGDVAAIAADYLKHSLTTGIPCDVAAANNAN